MVVEGTFLLGQKEAKKPRDSEERKKVDRGSKEGLQSRCVVGEKRKNGSRDQNQRKKNSQSPESSSPLLLHLFHIGQFFTEGPINKITEFVTFR